MNTLMDRLLRQAKTRKQAITLARLLAKQIHTWQEFGAVCGFLSAREQMPAEARPDDPIDPGGDWVRERIQNYLLKEWVRLTKQRILEEVIKEAIASLRSKWTRAGVCIGLNTSNAHAELYYALASHYQEHQEKP